jgi:hypothetical protein
MALRGGLQGRNLTDRSGHLKPHIDGETHRKRSRITPISTDLQIRIAKLFPSVGKYPYLRLTTTCACVE